jgi:hypothetical protein
VLVDLTLQGAALVERDGVAFAATVVHELDATHRLAAGRVEDLRAHLRVHVDDLLARALEETARRRRLLGHGEGGVNVLDDGGGGRRRLAARLRNERDKRDNQ